MTTEQKEFYEKGQGMPAREMYYKAVLRQIDAMNEWVEFVRASLMRGVRMQFTVEVDGITCITGPITLERSTGQEAMAWLYNWGCSRLMILFEERDEMRRLWPEIGVRSPQNGRAGE